MTSRQFFAALRKTPRTWRVTRRGLLRSTYGCPLTAVAVVLGWPRFPLDRWDLAASAIGLAPAFAAAIVDAADGRLAAGLRRRLLAACGVE